MDDTKYEFVKADIGKLELKVGDIVVLKFKEFLPEASKERIHSQLKKLISGDVTFLILDGGTEIEILREVP